MNENPIEQLIEEKELADRLQVSVGTLRNWRSAKKGPRFHRIGQRIRYSPSDVKAWLSSRQVGGDTAEVTQ